MEMEHSHLDDDWREVKAIHDYYRHKESVSGKFERNLININYHINCRDR